MKRAILCAVVAISVATPASLSAKEPLAPVQPGGEFCTPPVEWEERVCGTLGFVFHNQDGRIYITAPGHGLEEGDRVYTGYATDDGGGGPFPFGTGSSPGGFGSVVIDDDSEDDDWKGADVALINIDQDKRDYVSPSVRHWTGPSGVLGSNVGSFGDSVYTYGPNTVRKIGPQEGQLINRTANNFNSTLQLYEGPGASGSPYLYAADGSALGLNGNCLCGTSTFGYPTVDYVLRRFREFSDHGNLQLVPAQYHPPAKES